MTGIISDNTGRAGGLVKAAGGGGSLNYISSITISSGVGEFASLTTYDTYFIRFERMIGSASADNLVVLHETGAASGTYVTSGYAYSSWSYTISGSWLPQSRSASYLPISSTDPGSKYMSGYLYLFLKGRSATGTIVHGQNYSLENATGYESGRNFNATLDTGTIMDGIKFYRSSGNYTSGTLHLYGIGQS